MGINAVVHHHQQGYCWWLVLSNKIQYYMHFVEIATTGNAQDFGDLHHGDASRGYVASSGTLMVTEVYNVTN